MVSKEEVRAAYRLLLARDAESEEVVARHAARYSSTDELRQAFIKSPEFQLRVLGRPSAPPRPAPVLPAVSMCETCRFGTPIRILEPDAADGNVSFIELIVLNHLVAEQAPRVVFELGTFDGRTTVNLAANTPDEAVIYTVDLPQSQMDQALLKLESGDRKYIDKNASGARFASIDESAKIVQLFGDTASFDFSQWYNKVDFVFVDASHAAPYVRNDTEVALRLVGHRRGMIAWHDYNSVWPGVIEVLEDYQRSDPRLRDLAYVAGTSLALCKIIG